MSSDKEDRKSLALVRSQTLERAQGNAVPIEYRTLSIHVTETQRSNKTGEFNAKGPGGKGKGKSDDFSAETDFFATIDFHKLTPAEIDLRFNSNEALGLEQTEAERRLRTSGPNTLDTRKPNYIKKLLGYVFGGFCSVLWIGVITFFVCWQPPLSNPPNVTNLALAILVVSSISVCLQSICDAFLH
jgi:sodium/potassium-transporting ATPase subunit alpha